MVTEQQRDQLSEILSLARALRDSMDESVRLEGENIWKFVGYKNFARRYNDLVGAVVGIVGQVPLFAFDAEKMPGIHDTTAMAQKAYFDSARAELSLLVGYLENKLGVKDDESESLANFIQAKLRAAMLREPEKEVDVQDCVEQLFIGRGLARGIDYDRETGRVRVSAKEVVPDFILPRLGLALEVKLLRPSDRLGPVIDQINADIQSYSKQYSRLLFVIYDRGNIRDESQFKQGLEAKGRVAVVVVKH